MGATLIRTCVKRGAWLTPPISGLDCYAMHCNVQKFTLGFARNAVNEHIKQVMRQSLIVAWYTERELEN